MSFLAFSFLLSVRFEIDKLVMHVYVSMCPEQFYIYFLIFIIPMTNCYENDVFSLSKYDYHVPHFIGGGFRCPARCRKV